MKKSAQDIRIKGKIIHYNISPKGMYEGMLIETKEKKIQVNFPKEQGAVISASYPKGSTIELEVETYEDDKDRKGSHKVYSLTTLPKGKKKDAFSGQVKGKVKTLNYALHGEVNGAILESGDFIHMKPEGAKAVSLKVGQTLTVEGELRPSSLSNRVIEAFSVNGRSLEHGKKHERKSA
jgi:hypothetical protein